MKVAFASLRNDRSLQILEGFQESEAPIHHQSPCSPRLSATPHTPHLAGSAQQWGPVTGPVLSPCSPLLCSPDALPQLRDPLGAWLRGSCTCCGCPKGSRVGCKEKQQILHSWRPRDYPLSPGHFFMAGEGQCHTRAVYKHSHTRMHTHTRTQAHTQQAHTHRHFQTHSGPSTHEIGHTSTHTHTHTHTYTQWAWESENLNNN